MTRFLGLAALALVTLISSAHATSVATAPEIAIPKNASKIQLVKGQVLDVEHLLAKCLPRPGVECRNVTRIKLGFTIGCVDELAVSSHASIDERNKKITLNVAALSFIGKNANRVRCVRPNKKVATVLVRNDLNKVDDVEVEFQDKVATINDGI